MKKINVIHLMRTYGSHGGERQLSQYFSCQNSLLIKESFAFVYRDLVCSKLFSIRAPNLEQIVLFDADVEWRSAWLEFLMLLPVLFWLQLKFFLLVFKRRPNFVVAHGFQAALVAWPSAVFLKGCRWCYLHRATKSINHTKYIFWLIYKPFDAIIGNSQAVRQSLVKIVGSDRTYAIENGLNLVDFDVQSQKSFEQLPPLTGPVIVSVGRLLPRKGQSVIIEAFELLLKTIPNANLWIVGDGSEMAHLQQRASHSQASRKIHFLGNCENVPAILANCDLFVNASTREGLSNAVLEAMAARLPSVVVDAPGVSECHISGETGLIVANNAVSISEAAGFILAKDDYRKKMGDSARKRVEDYYSMNRNCERYLRFFSHFVGRNLCVES